MSEDHKQQLESQLWNIANTLRGKMGADKLKKVIDRYVYTGKKPLPDPDIIQLINRPLKLADRGPTRTRVLDKVVEHVETFIHGIAA
jgi:type I restriction enzyme R subunit